MIKALIFDFAGVIGTEGYSLWAKEQKAKGIESKSNYFHDISDDMDRGSISTQTFSQEVAKVVGIASSDVWKEISQKIKINNELLDLIVNLKKKYKTGLLTNYSDVWMKELISKYELDKYFDSVVISSLHKVIKPDKKIYQISLNMLKIKSEEALFFDDRPRNIEGGEIIGLKSFLFTTNQKLKKDLRSCGITV
ncbi:MAG: HAD family phosphatase [Candidatus Roizmanbacteria bacterium]|nr:HAD family phosphatase [Candidatus Roizmanbacteria bacterium]